MRPAIRFLVALACLAGWAIASALQAQTPRPATPSPAPDSAYYDVSADRSELKKINGETVLELTNNVRIVHGDVTVTSNRGTSFTIQRLTRLFGNVKVVQQTLVMTGDEGEYMQNEDFAVLRRNVHIVDRGWEVDCDEVRYSRLTGEATLIGHVFARDSTTTIRADRIVYQRLIQRAEAFGDVEMINLKDDIVQRGQHGIYYRAQGVGVVDEAPTLVVGTSDEEPTTVTADTMRVLPDSAAATAYYKVKIIKGSMITQCDSAMIYDKKQRVELFGSPLAKQDNVWMKGDFMVAHYNQEEVTRVVIIGNAEIRETPRDSLALDRDNWIRGDTLILYLHDNDVDSVRVTGSAESEYHPAAVKRVERNHISGDRMFMRMGKDEIEWVDVRGKAAGTYRYIDLKEKETADTLRAVADTSLKYVSFAEKSQRVDYAAEHIQYDATKKDLFLRKNSQVTYQGSVLTGETITYHSQQQLLDASGSPTLTEDNQKIYGERMDYDMESETGLVTKGSTQYEQGYYSGENLAKVGENEMKVWNSYYTTCDLKEPHYHFAAKDMKVYPDDKVFTGPIWLHIGKTPIVALPFMANSISRGRRSGFLRPDIEFGITNDSDRFIRGLGYYWATNDYTDFTFVADFEEDVRWRLYIGNRYALRYRFNGTVDYNYVRDVDGRGSEWTFENVHAQDLGERFSLNANLRFVSSDNAVQDVNTIDDVNRYIDRSLRSNVSLRKSWQTTAINLSATRVQNLNIVGPNAVKVQMTAPDFTLSIPSRNLYFGSDTGAPEGFWESLLKNTRYSPSLSGNYRRTEKIFETTDVFTGNAGLSLSSPQRIAFVTVSPSLNANLVSVRTDSSRAEHFEYPVNANAPADTDTVFVSALDKSETDHDFSWNVGASANTNFYGTFYPHVGRLRGVRHALTPSASYALTPARGDRPLDQRVSLSLRNAIDLKFAGKDTTESGEEEVRKLSGVVIWSLAAGYDPDVHYKDAWSTISSGLNFNLFGINLSVNHSLDPYNFDVLNTSATSGLNVNGTHPFGRTKKVEVRELNEVAASDTTRKDKDRSGSGIEYREKDEYGRDEPEEEREMQLEKGKLPWSLNLGLSYSKSRSGQVSSTLRIGWDLQLTDNWRIDYSTIYDVTERQLDGQNFGITRDLHCWEMTFARQELGDEWQFYFRIALKAHPDLYGESGTRGLGSGLMGQF